MSRPTSFSLRPSDKREWKGTLEGAFRVHLNRQDMTALGLQPGDFCTVSSTTSQHSGLAIAWPTSDPKLSQRLARVSDIFRDQYQFSLEHKVQIEKSEDIRVRARSVRIAPTDGSPLEEGFESIQDLRLLITVALVNLGTICGGADFDIHLETGNSKPKQTRRFRIDRIEPSVENQRPHIIKAETNIHLVGVEDVDSVPLDSKPSDIKINTDGIGGLETQVELLNKILTSRLEANLEPEPFLSSKDRRYPLVVLHGPEGTGKSLLLERFAAAPWQRVHWVDEGVLGSKASESCKALEKIFADARAVQPSLIALDGFEELFGTTEEQGKSRRVIRSLTSELRKSLGSKVVVITTTLNVSAISKGLRTANVFPILVEVPMPDARTRTLIMKEIMGGKQEALCQSVGENTPGFTGRDLVELSIEAADKAKSRSNQLFFSSQAADDMDHMIQSIPLADRVTEHDFKEARLIVRPTPLKEVVLETPKISWEDIGGAEDVKNALQKVTVWPYKYTDAMIKMGFTSQKGILLYGPPGCSKTLIAQAVANQGGLNFLAVKGGELLNMYVGESEKAIREVFRKARAASPSVIFFDEFDSIGRKDEDSGRSSGLNVVTTLLNEMDGIEPLTNVLVLAATNAPELLHPALMRPGRMDTILYVGPPNLAARKEILNIQSKGRPWAEDVSFDDIASKTEGYSGAEVVRIVDVAVEYALEDWIGDQKQEPMIRQRHFESALGKVVRQLTPQMRMRFESWQPGGVAKLV